MIYKYSVQEIMQAHKKKSPSTRTPLYPLYISRVAESESVVDLTSSYQSQDHFKVRSAKLAAQTISPLGTMNHSFR